MYTPISKLRSYFADGKRPNGQQFAELIKSLWHKSEQIPFDQIKGLADAVNSIQFEGAKTYQSLTELRAVSPVPADGTAAKVANDANEKNNGYYAVVNGAWVKDADLLAQVVEKDNTILPVTGKGVVDYVEDRETAFLQKKINVFTPSDTLTENVMIREYDGATQALAGYSASGFIKVKPNTAYVFSKVTDNVRIAFYEEATGVSYIPNTGIRIKTDTTGLVSNFTTPVQANYLRFSFNNRAISENEMYLQEGTTFVIADALIRFELIPDELKTGVKREFEAGRHEVSGHIPNRYYNASGEDKYSVTFDITKPVRIKEGESLFANTRKGVYSGLLDVFLNPIPDSFVEPDNEGVVELTGTKEGVYAVFSLRKNLASGISPNRQYLSTPAIPIFPPHEFNDLKTSPVLHLLHTGEYGAKGGRYKIQKLDFNFKVKFNFKVEKNVNETGSDLTLCEFKELGHKGRIERNAPEPLKENATQTMSSHYQQVVGYKSRVAFSNNNSYELAYPRQTPFCGKDAFNVWLKDVGNDRQQWLNEHQDICIGVIGDELRIYRDGIGADDSVHNSGANSIIKAFQLKSNGVAKSMLILYQEIEMEFANDTNLKGFEIDYEHIEGHTTDDLLRFDKVKMVAKSEYQIENGTKTRDLQYDSFPLHFPYWKDEKLHTCEIVSNGTRVWCVIDGLQMSKPFSVPFYETLVIGGEGLTVSNLEVHRGNLGDAEISGDGIKVISNANPYVLGLCGHKTFDSVVFPEGEPMYHQTLTRLLSTIELLKAKGYYIASITEIYDWKLRGKPLPKKRVAFFMLDDWNVENLWVNKKVRGLLLKQGAKINICNIEGRHDNPGYHENLSKEEYKMHIANMRRQGWEVCMHTWHHDYRYAWKTSLQLYDEIPMMIDKADEMGENSTVLCYAFGVPLTNFQKIIQYHGISMGIDTREVASNVNTWAMTISREAFQEGTDFEEIKKWII